MVHFTTFDIFFSDSKVAKQSRWTPAEHGIFMEVLGDYIGRKEMPPRGKLEKVKKQLGDKRTILQIRTIVHNVGSSYR